LRGSKDVKEFYLGGTGDRRNNLKSFKRRKHWL
jgi:branched-chain amino acid transport system ATP-binding protein